MLLPLKRTYQILNKSIVNYTMSSQRNFSNRIHDNFRFPKHNELFTQENLGADEDDIYITDEEDQGILRRYKPRRNITADDIMTEDFKKVRQNLQQQFQETYHIDTMSDTQAIEHTKSLISRIRQGRDLKGSLGKEFRRKRLQSEYLNHRKYEENFIERDDVYNAEDPARERLHIQNYRDAMKRMDIKNSEKEREHEKDFIRRASKQFSNDIDPDRFEREYIEEQK